MPVIGTAGHVDHGKSTLVQALTGRDPDRWEEEKRRGLTIDLGFSWMVLPGGVEASFVDVPGHERFAKNMLAGVDGIDIALLVVSAQEGWMPQSEEHLAVLDLLDISRGVVALTMVDRIDPDRVGEAAADVAKRIAGSSLAAAPVIPVSGVTHQGLSELIAALQHEVSEMDALPSGHPRMWIDRAFTVTGAGTVVTGTLLEGTLAQGDRVELWPGPVVSRVRSLQTHERPVERAEPRRRVAVNLVGVDRQHAHRGAMLGAPHNWLPTRRMSVLIKTPRYEPPVFVDKGSFHVHLGTSATAASIKVLEKGPPTIALVEMAESRPIRVGDRFIVRDVGKRRVVAGGRVLDPQPAKKRIAAINQAADVMASLSATPDEIATVLLKARSRSRLDVLAAHSGGGNPINALEADGWAIAPHETENMRRIGLTIAEDHHRQHPLAAGMATAELASQIGVPINVLVKVLAGSKDLAVAGSIVTLRRRLDARVEHPKWQAARHTLAETGLAPPPLASLGLDPDFVSSCTRDGSLIRVSEEFAFLPETMELFLDLLRKMPPEFTVSEFRQQAGLTRKHAIPLLEWADRKEITVRMGDQRRVVSRTQPSIVQDRSF